MNKKLIMVIVIFVLALTACANEQAAADPQSATPVPVAADGAVAEGKIKPLQASNLSFQVRGMVEEINVKVGDKVSKGDVLARLANASQAEAQLASANLGLVSAQQDLKELLDSSGSNLAQVIIDLKDAQEEYDDAARYRRYLNNEKRIPLTETRLDVQRSRAGWNYSYHTRYYMGPATQDMITESDNDLALKKSQLEALQRTYERMKKDGVDTDQLALREAGLENARAQVTAAESNLSNYVLTAPFDGVVADVAVEIGEQVGAESRAVSIVDASSWVIETTDITELEVVDVAVGQNVIFTADALSDVTMNGVVTEISQSSFVENGDVTYTVRIAANDVDPRVKWGMTVEVKFEPIE